MCVCLLKQKSPPHPPLPVPASFICCCSGCNLLSHCSQSKRSDEHSTTFLFFFSRRKRRLLEVERSPVVQFLFCLFDFYWKEKFVRSAVSFPGLFLQRLNFTRCWLILLSGQLMLVRQEAGSISALPVADVETGRPSASLCLHIRTAPEHLDMIYHIWPPSS